MLKIKTNSPIADFKGEPIKNGTKNTTVADIIPNILAGKTENPTLAWQLGKKFATEEEVDLKAEEIVFLKKEIEKNIEAKEYGYGSLVGGQLLELLEEKK